MYTYQVNYDKVFLAGLLIGHTCHTHLRFCDQKTAKAFADGDGKVFTGCTGASKYRQQNSIIIKLEVI